MFNHQSSTGKEGNLQGSVANTGLQLSAIREVGYNIEGLQSFRWLHEVRVFWDNNRGPLHKMSRSRGFGHSIQRRPKLKFTQEISKSSWWGQNSIWWGSANWINCNCFPKFNSNRQSFRNEQKFERFNRWVNRRIWSISNVDFDFPKKVGWNWLNRCSKHDGSFEIGRIFDCPKCNQFARQKFNRLWNFRGNFRRGKSCETRTLAEGNRSPSHPFESNQIWWNLGHGGKQGGGHRDFFSLIGFYCLVWKSTTRRSCSKNHRHQVPWRQIRVWTFQKTSSQIFIQVQTIFTHGER